VAKEDEIAYLSRVGASGRDHALNKPWSDDKRGSYLQEIGALLTLLPPPPARVLDLGAGSGWTSCLLASAGYRVTATDIAPEMVELQALNAQRYGVTLEAMVVCDFEHLPFVAEFDAVVFYDCLHHSDDEVMALRGAYTALKAGGVCITLEPGRGHHASGTSIKARETLGTTERDMPPSLIVTGGRTVGFGSHAVYDRPTDPTLITTGTRPSLKAITEFTKRWIVRSTPLAMTRGHFVVLKK
jgi:SAM-dependent methyltransferase